MRRAQALVTPELLRDLLGLPEDIHIHYTEYDYERDLITIYMMGGNLPEVPEAHVSPYIDLNDYKGD